MGTITSTKAILAAILLLAASFGVYLTGLNTQLQESDITFGSAPAGLPASIASTSVRSIGNDGSGTGTLIFTSNTSCASRVISTQFEAIKFSLGEISDGSGVAGGYGISSTTVTAQIGALQLASTTVNYDAGVYGCGEWYATAAVGGAETATPTISVFELR
mgnify:CR=1 FL=1